MRRRALLSTSAAPAQEQKGNVIMAKVNITFNDEDGYLLFGDGFDVSQVDYVHIVSVDDTNVVYLDGNVLLTLAPGEYCIEIGFNTLTNGDYMFAGTALLWCDFSDVDISQLMSCQEMFAGTLIKESPIRELNIPLSDYSCAGMFSYCENLTIAPILSANAVPDMCYTRMFYGCTSLTYIRLLATDIEETSLCDWLTDATEGGTLVKNADATWESPYIPDGWTVITTEDELKPPAGLEYPIVLRYDSYDYDDDGALVESREADEYSLNLYSFLQSTLNEYGSLMWGSMIITSVSITQELGLAIFIEGGQCVVISKRDTDAYIEIGCIGEDNTGALYEDGTMVKI